MPNFENEARVAVSDGSADEIVQKLVEQDDLAKKAGFVEWSNGGETFFSWGTKLEAIGQEAFKQRVRTHEEIPPASDALEAVKALISAENRHVVTKPIPSIRMGINQEVILSSDENVTKTCPISTWAMNQLLMRSNAPGGTVNILRPPTRFTKLDDGVVASVFNNYMQKASGARGPKETNLRVRTWRGKDEIFAAVSPQRYNIMDFPDAVQYMLDSLSVSNGRGSFMYDGKKWRFTTHFMNELEPRVGEIFQCQISIEGSDNGEMPIRIKVELVRVRCLNLTTMISEEMSTVRHNRNDMKECFTEKVKEMFGKISAFPELWNKASTRLVCEQAAELGVDKVFDILVHKGLVEMPGLTHEEQVNRLKASWSLEPGWSVADISNAISRAANQFGYNNPWALTDLADQAGNVLYVKNVITPKDIVEQEERFANLEV